MIMSIIDGINRFLSSLNISQKYLNRLYTIASVLPIFYILMLSLRFYKQHNIYLFSIYLIVFVFFFYFLCLNTLYYFFDKNTTLDITQHVASFLPDEVFYDEIDSNTERKDISFIDLTVKEDFNVEKFAKELLAKRVNTDHNGVELNNRGFLLPYYKITKGRTKNYIKVSVDGIHFTGVSGINNKKINKEVIGVFLFGGNVLHDGVLIREPYSLKIAIRN